MSTCARCGLEQPEDELTMSGNCALPPERIEACRQREMSNLRSLLRSVTAKLEEAAELLEPPNGAGYVNSARQLVVEVLEVLA